jgi:hypothetical protein
MCVAWRSNRKLWAQMIGEEDNRTLQTHAHSSLRRHPSFVRFLSNGNFGREAHMHVHRLSDYENTQCRPELKVADCRIEPKDLDFLD